ncbi:hypothetical protein F5Y07DRAFT_23956 [Xylaria sp. FL0933]|nr:hypothetical protein F5Y07DRAFT_23956 [Xylaria sp. FL0933]
MYLRDEPLIKLLAAIQDNVALLKLVFDPHEHHPELGPEETREKLQKQLQRLVHFQVHLLFASEYLGEQHLRHRFSIFRHIYARLHQTDPRLDRWRPLMPGVLRRVTDRDHMTIPQLLADLGDAPSAEERIKDLLALAEECAEANARTAPARPDMGALRRALENLTAGMEPLGRRDDGDGLTKAMSLFILVGDSRVRGAWTSSYSSP